MTNLYSGRWAFMLVLTLVSWRTSQGLDPSIVTSVSTSEGPFVIQHSASQLSRSSSAAVIIIPGSDLDTGTSSITGRYACGNYLIAFDTTATPREIEVTVSLTGAITTGDNPSCGVHIDGNNMSITQTLKSAMAVFRYDCGNYSITFATTATPREIEVTVSLTGAITTGDDPSCDVHMGDGNDLTITMNSASESDVHVYATYDVYVVNMTCISDVGTAVCPLHDDSCVVTSDFFDDAHLSLSIPLKYFTTDALKINSFMELMPGCGEPTIVWRLTEVDGENITHFDGFAQPNSSVLVLEAGTLEPGEYVVHLELLFPAAGDQFWSTDTMAVRVLYPELVAHIYGGDERTVSLGETITIDATRSFDPAGNLTEPLQHQWAFAKALVGQPALIYQAKFPFRATFAGRTVYNVTPGTDFLLQVDTSPCGGGYICFVMFSLIRGSRASSALQVIRTVTGNALPVYIECVYNCNVYRENKFNSDRLELDAVFPEEITDTSAFTYTWKVFLWTQTTTFLTTIYQWGEIVAPLTSTGVNTRSIGILMSQLLSGNTYKIALSVSAPGYAVGRVSIIGTINYPPYTGTCAMDTLNGTAARDWFVLMCSGWKGSDDRLTRNTLLDTNPYLTYTVRQYTRGAFVEEEPILHTRFGKSHLILKLGDPLNNFETTLTVLVNDLYNNHAQISIVAQAHPAFEYFNVNASDYGAGLIMKYTNVDYVADELQIRYMGKVDLLIPLISSVCSHIHLIEIPVWKPPVPRVLNQDNKILDLSPDGNAEVGGLATVLEDAKTPQPDNATLTLMEVMQNMTNTLRGMIDELILNGTRGSDKILMSMITNCFTNLVAKDQFANSPTRLDLIYLGEMIGVKALEPVENSPADQSAQIEMTSGEVYNMTQAIVNTVVPNNLNQARVLQDFVNSKKQIDDMLSVSGGGIDLRNSDLSPGERSYLYKQMQGNLQIDLRKRHAEAKKAADMARTLALEVLDKLKVCKTCSNEDSLTTNQLVKKNSADVINTAANRMEKASFRIDGMVESLAGNESSTANTALSAVEFQENVFMYDTDTRSSYVTSNVLHIDVKVNDTFLNPDYFTYGQTVTAEPELITPTVDPEDASEFSFHRFIYQSVSDYVCLVVKPEDEVKVTSYSIYIRFEAAPSIMDFDLLYTVTVETFWRVCIEPVEMQGHQGVVYLAVHVPAAVVTVRYYFTLVTAGCMVWEEATTTWYIDKCEMTWVPEFNKINCFCRNLTELTVANSFFVAPNTIDFSSVFLKFSPLNQAAVMGALGGLFLIYIIAVLLVMGLDRRDKLKWGITPLRDNIYGHDTYYIIKVFTGMRRGAGTSSRIAFNLFGKFGATGPRELFDGIRQHFSTGSVITLFMATKNDLGLLTSLNIWHDNSGEGDLASWYLNGVAVYDIARNETYMFVAEGWLSLETTVDITLEAINTKDKPPDFENRFYRQTRDRLSESHMWVSILYRPVTSSFTRVQRASCALVYICLAMIANAMYFNPEPDYATPPLIQIGPFRFTGQQLFISLICAVITTPVVMLLIFLFKRTRPWPSKPCKDGGGGGCCRCICRCTCPCGNTRKKEMRRQYEASLRKRLLTQDVPDIGGEFRLNHWFIFLAWFLVIAGTVVPAFFIMLYSMEWGKQKSEEWLTAFLLSVFQSMIFVDPIMVVCLSFVFACLCRKVQEPLAIDTSALITNYKRWMGEITSNEEGVEDIVHILKSIQDEHKEFQVLPRNVTKTLHDSEFSRAAEEYRHRQQLSAMLRDIFLNLIVMATVFCICYSNRDDFSYYHHREIENNVITPRKLPHFHNIKTPADVFTWVNKSAIPYLFPEADWNDGPLPWTTKQYTSGLYTLRVGPPRLRQLRILNGTCKIPYIGEQECYGEYGHFAEDTRDFCVGWTPGSCSLGVSVFSPSVSAWTHVTGREIWGFPIAGKLATYSGGGYIAALYINRNDSTAILNELFDALWMDRQTRAVFFEFTLYCAETNIFIYNMFLTEFPETGGAFTKHSVYPMRLYTHQGPVGTLTLIFEIIFVIIIVVFTVKICIRLYQQRCGYFCKFWQVYELLMVLLGYAAIVMFGLRLVFRNLTIDKFKEDSNLFVDFSQIALWHQLFVILMAILTYMATIRFLQVFSTSKKVNAIVKIFKDCGGDLFSFGASFVYIIIGFGIFAFLVFGAYLYSFMDLYMSLRSLFLLLLGQSRYEEIDAIQPILGNIFYFMYVLTALFFALTIFMSILGGSIDTVMHGTREDDKEDLIEHIMARFKALLIKPDTKSEL